MPPVTRSRSNSTLVGRSSSSYPAVGPSDESSSGFIFEISRPDNDAKWSFSICDATPDQIACVSGKNKHDSVELDSTGSPEYTRTFLSRDTVQKECQVLAGVGGAALIQKQKIPAEDMVLVVQFLEIAGRNSSQNWDVSSVRPLSWVYSGEFSYSQILTEAGFPPPLARFADRVLEKTAQAPAASLSAYSSGKRPRPNASGTDSPTDKKRKTGHRRRSRMASLFETAVKLHIPWLVQLTCAGLACETVNGVSGKDKTAVQNIFADPFLQKKLLGWASGYGSLFAAHLGATNITPVQNAVSGSSSDELAQFFQQANQAPNQRPRRRAAEEAKNRIKEAADQLMQSEKKAEEELSVFRFSPDTFGKVEIKTSGIPNAGLGIFAGVDFQKDDVITEYAGQVLDPTGSPNNERNYDLTIPGENTFVLRGYISEKLMQKLKVKTMEKGSRKMARYAGQIANTCFPCKNENQTQNAEYQALNVPRKASGVGARINDIQMLNKTRFPRMFVVAKRDIQKGQEIFTFYDYTAWEN